MLLNFLKKISFWGLLSLMGPKMGPDGSFSSFMEKNKQTQKAKKTTRMTTTTGHIVLFFRMKLPEDKVSKSKKNICFGKNRI